MTGKFELPSNWRAYATRMKAQFLVSMKPLDFIQVTTPAGSYRKKVLEEDRRFSYEEYLKFRNQTDPPILFLNFDKGRIRDHEGRHRAAAYHDAGGKEFHTLIAVDPLDDSFKLATIVSDLFKTLFHPHQMITWKTIPKTIKEQFEGKTVNIKTDWKLIEELVKV